ncbi:MAG TPA: nickel-binding protein [Candidatus Limnocylindria bacterium]|nr:nickel-binding protein [Candidatus Limnocylindria bacterium]
MPVFIDIHDVAGATAEDIARAHAQDVAVQDQYGVNYVKYWLNESRGKVFCLCTAPSAEAAELVHCIGLAAGVPIERNDDFFGSTVQLASRLCMHAAPGQTLVSASVAELCDEARFVDLDELALKGFVQPVRAHAVAEDAR